MPEANLDTPVLFMIFNRPDCTQKVFERIRSAQPKELFVAADGPRADKPGEAELCRQAREVIGRVDWDCEVKTLLRDTNVGCKRAESGAMNWFFENVEEGIILEDDNLPDPTFFRYCRELLIKYRYDNRITMISGNNFQFGRNPTNYSYYFSRLAPVWGWATWRRAWQHYDVNISHWPEIRDGGWLYDFWDDKKRVEYWTGFFNRLYRGEMDVWSYQWLFACCLQGGLNIIPNVNLISNIGFGPAATHTKVWEPRANMKIEPMIFPLRHPPFFIRSKRADDVRENDTFSSNKSSMMEKISEKLRRVIQKNRR